MPELPEVETLKLGLQKYLVGRRILDVEVLHPKILFGDKKDIIGAKVIGIKRMGKGLIIELSNNYSLAIHVKLTGQLIYSDENTKNETLSPKVGTIPNKFTHLIFHLSPLPAINYKLQPVLYYNDQRRFGWIKVVKTSDVMSLPFFKEMGPEPFKDLTIEKFEKIISASKTVLKPLLMDQKKIGGIGNIYANDALFLARILPSRKANTLSLEEIKKLYESILSVLQKGLDSGGASELTFVNILGQDGGYQNHTLVYGKRGKKCPKCGAQIQFAKIGGRGTYFCLNCQK